MADADTTQKLNPEEQAAVDRARTALEASKAAVGQPLPALRDPLWLLTPEGMAVLGAALGRDEKGQPREVHDRRVTAIVPTEFVLTLTHHHKFDFQPGIRELPEALLDHPWVRGHGVTAYERPKSAPPPVLLGSATMSDPVKVGDRRMPLGPFVVAAHTASGLTVNDWNALTDEERDARIQAEVDVVASADRPDGAGEDKSGNAGKAKLKLPK